MKIFLPFKLSPTGGSSAFARKFKTGMEQKGHHVSFGHFPDYDLLFVNAICPSHFILDAFLRRRPILHRLDGVYYPMSSAGRLWPMANFPLKLIHRLFSQYTVYQSVYSRTCVNRFLGENQRPSTVIYNGVDPHLFSPQGPIHRLRQNPSAPTFITASRFRRPDQILPLLDAFSIYQNRQPHANLHVIGNFEGPVANIPRQPPKGVHFHGIVPNDGLPRYLRAADAFLFTHLNPPCPNNIIEAMSCGLPIAGVADGAMPEICVPGKNAELVPASGDGFLQPRHLDLKQFAHNLDIIMERQTAYAKFSRQLALKRYTLEHMLDKYLAVMQTTITP